MKTLKTLPTGHNSIESIHITEFKTLNCAYCKKPISNKGLIQGQYVRPRSFVCNSLHNILVVVHPSCKKKYIYSLAHKRLKRINR